MFRYITRTDYRKFKIFVKTDFILSNNTYIREAVEHRQKYVMPYLDENYHTFDIQFQDAGSEIFYHITFERLDQANWFMLKFADVITTEGYNFE